MGEPRERSLRPTIGLGVLHLFVRFASGTDTEALLAAVKEARQDGDQVVSVAVLGHKADMCLLVLGPDLWRLHRFQASVRRSGAEVVWSYTSLTELSEYGDGLPEEMKQARLYPSLPPEGKPAFCFYPMSKRRGAEHNWYALGFEERKELMIGTRCCREALPRPGASAHNRVDRLGRLGMGCHALRYSSRRLESSASTRCASTGLGPYMPSSVPS